MRSNNLTATCLTLSICKLLFDVRLLCLHISWYSRPAFSLSDVCMKTRSNSYHFGRTKCLHKFSVILDCIILYAKSDIYVAINVYNVWINDWAIWASDKRSYKNKKNKKKTKHFQLRNLTKISEFHERTINSLKRNDIEKITVTKPVKWTWHFPSCPEENQLWEKVGCDDRTWKQHFFNTFLFTILAVFWGNKENN